MNFVVTKLVIVCFLIIISWMSYGQTYTSNGNCTSWSDGNCWTKVNDPGSCTNNISLFPPSIPTGCPVKVVINHSMTKSTGMTLGGTFESITFGDNGSLNILGPLEISSNYTLSVYGSSTGTGNYLTANALNINLNSTIFIDENAGMIILGITNFKSENGKIKVDGFYRTNTISTTGNSSGTLEVDVNAIALVEGNVDMNGNSKLFFTGSGTGENNAIVEIGGRIKTNGTGSEITADAASVYICNGIDAAVQRTETNGGVFVTMCRALNIPGLSITVTSNVREGYIAINCKFSSPGNSFLFVLERSLDGIDDFLEIGMESGANINPVNPEFSFVDYNFPPNAKWAYYRIRQVDEENNLNYSNLFRIKIPGNSHSSSKVWQVYPNPLETGTYLKMKLVQPKSYAQEKLQISLITPQYVKGPFPVKDPKELGKGLQEALETAPGGLILLEIKWGRKKEYHKIIRRK